MSEIVSVEKAIAKLKEAEVWPFYSSDIGFTIPIYEDKFYGFYDCGGIYNVGGRSSQEELVQHIKQNFDDYSPGLVTIDPEQLGEYAITVLSGRQFVDRLYSICNYHKEHFDDYGRWSSK